MKFEWDENKNLNNQLKHNLSLEDAQYAFLDLNRIILKDEKHSDVEDRFFCIRMIGTGIATIRFTLRKHELLVVPGSNFRIIALQDINQDRDDARA